MNTKKYMLKSLAMGMALVAALGVAAVAPGQMAQAASKKSAVATQEIGYTDAVKAAQKKASGTVVEIDWDRGDGRYEIEIVDQKGALHKIDIDTEDGSLLRHTTRKLSKTKARRFREVKVGYDKAIQAAMKATGAKTLLSCELDYDDGSLAFDIELADSMGKYEVQVSADTGKVLYQEYDD